MCTPQSRKVVWDGINTLLLTLQLLNQLLLPSFNNRKHRSMASRAILSNFFQNHPQIWNCGVNFFQQPFPKQLYLIHYWLEESRLILMKISNLLQPQPVFNLIWPQVLLLRKISRPRPVCLCFDRHLLERQVEINFHPWVSEDAD